jgi:hypothetical protein
MYQREGIGRKKVVPGLEGKGQYLRTAFGD